MGRRRVQPFADARSTGERRPDYGADQRRRRAFVRSYLREHGEQVERGIWRCTCELCGRSLVLPLSEWWADHVTAVADGGSEDGPLQLSCKACQITQGSRVANAHNPRAVPRKRPPEAHPGAIAPQSAGAGKPRGYRGQRR